MPVFNSLSADEAMRKPRPIDWQDRELLALARVWNRSDRETRLEFLEIANEAEGGIIDP